VRPDDGAGHDFGSPETLLVSQFAEHTEVRKGRTVVDADLPVGEREFERVVALRCDDPDSRTLSERCHPASLSATP